MLGDILIVDDESSIRSLIRGILEDENYTVREAATGREAFEQIKKSVPSLVILDIWLQNSDHDGLEILEDIKKDHPTVPVLMISGHGTIETAVTAIKKGAYDFIEKPFKSDRLLLMIDRAIENMKLKQENKELKKKVEGPSNMVGKSPAMTSLHQLLQQVAQTNSRVLISGEAGTGKEVVARALHRLSPRRDGPFVALNCAMLRSDRFDIELFGLAEGVSGEPPHPGVLERAQGGTLLLDEVADMPLDIQGKILRVLQDQKFQRVGGQKEHSANTRIIASTNQNLEKAIRDGLFRDDLFYRLNVVPVKIPPLRERVQDIEPLIEYFNEQFEQSTGLPQIHFTQKALLAMQGFHWPGNVRQLRNIVESMMILCSTTGKTHVEAEDLPPDITGLPSAYPSKSGGGNMTELMSVSLRESRELFEKQYLAFQIKRFNGNISQTAQFVGMERSALHRKMKTLGISALQKQNDNVDSKATEEKTMSR